MELSLHDLNFCIQLMMDFSFACNHEDETMLSDFLTEHYTIPDESWHQELSGGSIRMDKSLNPGTALFWR